MIIKFAMQIRNCGFYEIDDTERAVWTESKAWINAMRNFSTFDVRSIFEMPCRDLNFHIRESVLIFIMFSNWESNCIQIGFFRIQKTIYEIVALQVSLDW